MIIWIPLLQRHQDSTYSGKTSIYSIVDPRNYLYHGIFLMFAHYSNMRTSFGNIYAIRLIKERRKYPHWGGPNRHRCNKIIITWKTFKRSGMRHTDYQQGEVIKLCNTIKWYIVAHLIKCISLRSSFTKTIMKLSTPHPPRSLLLRFQI